MSTIHVVLFIKFENCAKHCDKAIKALLIDVLITLVSNYRYPITRRLRDK